MHRDDPLLITGLSEAEFKSANYSGIMYYKLGIMLFNLAPYLALRIMA